MLPPGSWAPSRPGDFDAPSNVRPEDRPATAPDDVYRQTSSATGSTRKSSDSDETAQPGSKRQMTSEEVENEEIDQFLDEGDRLANRPNSAPAGSSPTRKKKFFPKRVPKKRDNAAHAIEEARRKKELMEAEELMRMQSLKKTWLRAIQDEPSELGIDKYVRTRKNVDGYA